MAVCSAAAPVVMNVNLCVCVSISGHKSLVNPGLYSICLKRYNFTWCAQTSNQKHCILNVYICNITTKPDTKNNPFKINSQYIIHKIHFMSGCVCICIVPQVIFAHKSKSATLKKQQQRQTEACVWMHVCSLT